MVNIALIVIYVLSGIGLLLAAYSHGDTRKENFWISLIAKVLTLVCIWWALGWRFI